MSKHQRGKRGEPKHARLYKWMADSPAWKDLTPYARAIWLEIAMRYSGNNNGFIVYSVRQAADDLKISKGTAARAFTELEEHGFIVAEQRGAFEWKIDLTGLRHRPASEWRLTDQHNDRVQGIESRYPTKEFMRWAGVPRTAPKYPSRRKIQNTVTCMSRDDSSMRPYGLIHETMNDENSQNGLIHESIKRRSRR